MKLLFFLSMLLCTSAVAQQTGDTYHVTARSLYLRTQPNANSKALAKLHQYTNLTVVATPQSKGWVKVDYLDMTGYVARNYLKKGRVTTDVGHHRIGAICNDGTRSKAVRQGACSHHGGVDYWLYNDTHRVSIEE